jgi:hypothetical protein
MTRYLLLFDSYGLVFCGAPSLTRGRVCLLYMLLALDRAVFLGSESLWTRDHILLSQIWDFPQTRRVTVEVLDPASTLVSSNSPPILLTVPTYNSSARTPRKTRLSVVKNACLLARYLAMYICGPHRKHLLPPGSIVACAYFGRCLEMCLHVTVVSMSPCETKGFGAKIFCTISRVCLIKQNFRDLLHLHHQGRPSEWPYVAAICINLSNWRLFLLVYNAEVSHSQTLWSSIWIRPINMFCFVLFYHALFLAMKASNLT